MIRTTDYHTGGEPFRIVTGGVEAPRGETVTKVAGYPAVVTEVQGTAYRTGRSEPSLDPDDPLREGFLLR